MHDGKPRGIFYTRGEAVDVLTILLADHASFDEQKKLNVMGAFNEVHASKFPARHPLMVIVTRLAASAAEVGRDVKFSIKILDDDGKVEVFNYSRDIHVNPPTAPGRRTNIDGVLRVHDIVFPKPGNYQVSVLVDGDEKGSVPVYVVKDD